MSLMNDAISDITPIKIEEAADRAYIFELAMQPKTPHSLSCIHFAFLSLRP
ncbi:uncharacterized protein PHALS_03033 [Plasmopara halstedii]|uniref:Uncharacterized protein n=1 Tax=Plasmopara halstedii TaxID=4781 RepID=A0A0P1A7K4_PLAHL|nr:uncharacterized protein PHALS_03033 [Plasmopara halstedii]CEG36485.1 hypothetical protein PHALS_03033 [Plasmopara halstedii]|eukprot:XP_024572854.1 hypothetical protein PHALS_03033 [Plasmopara halstedii]